jgi:hypothetical protein
MARQSQRTAETTTGLRRAFEEAATVAASVARLDSPTAPEVNRAIGNDLAADPIQLDRHGLTAGAHAAVVGPARSLLKRWQAQRAVFFAALEPRRADIDALRALPSTIADMLSARDAEIAQLRHRWAERPRNALIEQQWQTAETVYQRESLRHGQRLAIMHAYSPFYWLAMMLIGIAEWLINYDVFLSFTGVVAIAAGATIILGVLLALAAHGHGELLKQWSYRFGRFQTRQSRVGARRMLALSTFAVVVVLAAAGGSRYAAVLRNAGQAHQPDLIGGGYQLEFNPLRDVLLSLLANIAAWIVGVFISYLSHDVDPEFMAATHQHRRCSRAFFGARRRLEEDIQVVQERTSREVTAAENSAAARRASTETERAMLAQITQHDEAVQRAILFHLRSELERYRAELLQAIRASHPQSSLLLEQPGAAPIPLALDALAGVPISVDQSLLEQAH